MVCDSIHTLECTVTLCLSNLAPSLPPLVTLCVSFLTDTWTAQNTTGDKPPPLGGHTFTRITENKAVVFGGYSSDLHNDTYVLDMDTWV